MIIISIGEDGTAVILDTHNTSTVTQWPPPNILPSFVGWIGWQIEIGIIESQSLQGKNETKLKWNNPERTQLTTPTRPAHATRAADRQRHIGGLY